MTKEAQCNLVVACARLLYVNGQGTEQVLAAAHRLARALGLRCNLSLRWGELQLQLEEGNRPIWRIAANPAGVDMNRVTAGMRVIDDVEAGRLTPEGALKAIDRFPDQEGAQPGFLRSPPVPALRPWLLSLAFSRFSTRQ